MSAITIHTIIATMQALLPQSDWTPSNRPELGLLSSNYAFIQAKKVGQNPAQYATTLVHNLQLKITTSPLKNLVDIANTGPFINLRLTHDGWAALLPSLHTPQLIADTQRAVMLEYVSPNVAKPLHVGHMRNANIGESLFRILRLKYTNLLTDNHWGDWGVQFGILLWAWKQFEQMQSFQVVVNNTLETVEIQDYTASPINTLVKLYVWGNQQKDTVENWEAIVRQEFVQLEAGDVNQVALWKRFVDVSQQEIAGDLQRLRVTPHNLNQGESFYEQDMKMLTDFCEKNGLWKTDGAARYFDFSELLHTWTDASAKVHAMLKKVSGGGEIEIDVKMGRGYLISSQGYTTYLFRDVATRWQYARDHTRDLMIALTDHSQTHNFDQTFVIVEYLRTRPEFIQFAGVDIANRLKFENLIHLPYGYLSLPEGKMSTRKGNFLTARELLDKIEKTSAQTLLEKNPQADANPDFIQLSQKVAIAALKWFDLSRDCVHDVVLDIPKILQFEGNTGVYQLYTLARLRSIVTKNYDGNVLDLHIDPAFLNQTEKMILQKLALMPTVLDTIVHTYKPHHLCGALFEIASSLNSWYAKHSVTAEENPQRQQTLLAFCQITANHIASHLQLLAIDPVDEM